MFIHPEEDYDFVVKLQPAMLPRFFQNITANPLIWTDRNAYSLSTDGEGPFRPGFDPVEAYLNDLTVRTRGPVVVL
jgi:U3 small nucleolar RNA-associated protein 22